MGSITWVTEARLFSCDSTPTELSVYLKFPLFEDTIVVISHNNRKSIQHTVTQISEDMTQNMVSKVYNQNEITDCKSSRQETY